MKKKTEKLHLVLGWLLLICSAITDLGGGDADSLWLAAVIFISTSAIIDEIRALHD